MQNVNNLNALIKMHFHVISCYYTFRAKVGSHGFKINQHTLTHLLMCMLLSFRLLI